MRLLTLLGAGPFAAAVHEELVRYEVPAVDFAGPGDEVLPVSSIVVVPAHGSRTIINQQPPQGIAREPDVAALLDGVAMVLVDGHLPDLVVPLCREARSRRIPVVLDGGSWKSWTGEIIPHVDCAIVSAGFHPGGVQASDLLAAVHALGPGEAAVTARRATARME